MTSTIMFFAKYCNGLDWAVRHKQFRKKSRRDGSFRFFARRVGYGFLSGTAWKKRKSTISQKLYMKMLYNRLVNKQKGKHVV